MKSVKWLFALFFALTFTLAVEFAGTFAVLDGGEWCAALTVPKFTTGNTLHSALWCIVYLLEAFVVSQMIVSNRMRPFITEYLIIKFLCAVWTVVFFTVKSPFMALVILTVILAFNFDYCRNLLKIRVHPYKSAFFLPVLVWYCYLWIINYCIVMLNN